MAAAYDFSETDSDETLMLKAIAQAFVASCDPPAGAGEESAHYLERAKTCIEEATLWALKGLAR